MNSAPPGSARGAWLCQLPGGGLPAVGACGRFALGEPVLGPPAAPYALRGAVGTSTAVSRARTVFFGRGSRPARGADGPHHHALHPVAASSPRARGRTETDGRLGPAGVQFGRLGRPFPAERRRGPRRRTAPSVAGAPSAPSPTAPTSPARRHSVARCVSRARRSPRRRRRPAPGSAPRGAGDARRVGRLRSRRAARRLPDRFGHALRAGRRCATPRPARRPGGAVIPAPGPDPGSATGTRPAQLPLGLSACGPSSRAASTLPSISLSLSAKKTVSQTGRTAAEVGRPDEQAEARVAACQARSDRRANNEDYSRYEFAATHATVTA